MEEGITELVGTYKVSNIRDKRSSILLTGVENAEFCNGKEKGESWVSFFSPQEALEGVPANGTVKLKVKVQPLVFKNNRKYVNLAEKVENPIEVLTEPVVPQSIEPEPEKAKPKVGMDDYKEYLKDSWEDSYKISQEMMKGKANDNINEQTFELALAVFEKMVSPFHYFLEKNNSR